MFTQASSMVVVEVISNQRLCVKIKLSTLTLGLYTSVSTQRRRSSSPQRSYNTCASERTAAEVLWVTHSFAVLIRTFHPLWLPRSFLQPAAARSGTSQVHWFSRTLNLNGPSAKTFDDCAVQALQLLAQVRARLSA